MTRLQICGFIPIIKKQYGDWGKMAEWERDAYLKGGVKGWYVKNAKGHITYTEQNFSKVLEDHSKTDKSWHVLTLTFAHTSFEFHILSSVGAHMFS